MTAPESDAIAQISLRDFASSRRHSFSCIRLSSSRASLQRQLSVNLHRLGESIMQYRCVCVVKK
jgi:hypothetical protein